MKGALEEVLSACNTYNHGGLPLPLTPQLHAGYLQEEKRVGAMGLRGQLGHSRHCHTQGQGWWQLGSESRYTQGVKGLTLFSKQENKPSPSFNPVAAALHHWRHWGQAQGPLWPLSPYDHVFSQCWQWPQDPNWGH